jgi:uncharacterized membrane protein YedE/YeeE
LSVYQVYPFSSELTMTSFHITLEKIHPDMLLATLTSMAAGAVFGTALTASLVYLPTVIIGQLQLRDFHMLQAFLTASGTSAVVMLTFERLGISQRKVRPNSTLNWFSQYDANILGGALIGIGMSLTGACPGTVIVQIANGVSSGIYVAIGAVLGGFFFAKFGKPLVTNCQYPPPPSAETIAVKLNTDPMKVFLAFEAMCAGAVAVASLVTRKESHGSFHPIAGGLLIGCAQATSVLLTNTPLGVSTAYEQIGGYIWRALGQTDVAAPPSPPQALTFASGILLGSAVSATFLPPAPVEVFQVSKLSAVVGGFVMLVGSRAAGGCTSGHGISGLSCFSFSSLVTVAAMFSGGIITAMLWT